MPGSAIEFRETVRAFSDELVALQQPIRSLDSVAWGDELRVIFDMKTSVAQYYLGRGHQIAIRTNLDRLEKWNGPARRFRACALLTALTIVFDALNLWADRDTEAPDPEPTRVILIDETGS